MPTTWNPSDKEAHITLSNGNLTATGTAGWTSGVRSVNAQVTGKYYWEYTWTTITGANDCVGVAGVNASLTNTPVGNAAQRSVIAQNGIVYLPTGAASSVNLGTITNGTVVGMAVDLANSLIWFRLGAAGNWNGNASNNPATGVGGVSMGLGGTALYAYAVTAAADVVVANFTGTFTGAVPAGFTSGYPSSSAPVQANITQIALEQWARATPAVQLTQVAIEHWATVALAPAVTPQSYVMIMA